MTDPTKPPPEPDFAVASGPDRPRFVGWIRRMLGIDCCGPWTQWEKHEADFQRIPLDLEERIRSNGQPIVETKIWQERHCSACGKVQQSKLDY